MEAREQADGLKLGGEPLDLGKLSHWAPELARTFVALSSDIALVIDGDGVIRTVEQGKAEPIAAAARRLGRPAPGSTPSAATRAARSRSC